MNELKGTTLKEVFIEYAKLILDGEYEQHPDLDKILETFKEKKYGIMIYGMPGSGKTFIFEVLHRIINPITKYYFRKINVLDVVLDFNVNGHQCFKKYRDNDILFDDLGTEDRGVYFGDKVEVFEKMIQFRYEIYKSSGIRTFFTSNLDENEIKSRYGLRCFSRLCEMSNRYIINDRDKRKDRNFKGFITVIHNTETQEDKDWKIHYENYKEYIKNLPPVKMPTIGELMRKSIGKKIPESEIQKEINKLKR